MHLGQEGLSRVCRGLYARRTFRVCLVVTLVTSVRRYVCVCMRSLHVLVLGPSRLVGSVVCHNGPFLHLRRRRSRDRRLRSLFGCLATSRRYGSRLREIRFLSQHRQRHKPLRSRQCLHRWLMRTLRHHLRQHHRRHQRHSRHHQRLMRTSRRLSRGSTPRRRRSRQRHSRHCQRLMRTSHRLSRGATIWRYSRWAFYLLATSSSATSAMQSYHMRTL